MIRLNAAAVEVPGVDASPVVKYDSAEAFSCFPISQRLPLKQCNSVALELFDFYLLHGLKPRSSGYVG